MMVKIAESKPDIRPVVTMWSDGETVWRMSGDVTFDRYGDPNGKRFESPVDVWARFRGIFTWLDIRTDVCPHSPLIHMGDVCESCPPVQAALA